MEKLLATKLYIPHPRPEIVHRPRLIERLNDGITRKMTLICAPAGFGKTTLLSDWIQTLKHPVAWLSLDKGDNDQTSFLVYLVAALQTVEADICESVQVMLLAPQPPPMRLVLIELINEVDSIERDFVLVLDDYHVIEAQAVHDALTFLIDHLPQKMHLVIASRSDPLLQIPNLRAKGQLSEIRAENLRFTSQEAGSFLNQVMGLALSKSEIHSLETRTEGWIAGLHLAALSMQDKKDVAKFITDFAGDNRYIVDYLIDEVLAQRPRGTKDFLLQTSILDRMTGSLCDAVTGQEGGQEGLERLDQANLFIVPLDSRRRWYRYHHLFADFMRQRLAEAVNSHEIKILHRRASQWFEEHEFLVEAVDHALRAEDFDNVIRLIDLRSEEILMRGQQSLLLKWQDELSRELVASHPRVCMTIAWAWLSMDKPQEAEACLQLLEQFLGIEMVEIFSGRDRAEKIDPAIQLLLVEIAVMRMELAIRQGNLDQVFELSQLVLPYLEDGDESRQDHHLDNLRSVVFFVLGLAYKISGNLGEAGKALSKAAVIGREQGNVYIAAGSLGRLASVQFLQGHLSQAVRTCQRGMMLVQEMVLEPPMSGLIHAELGNLLYERNELHAALHHLQEGIEVARPWGFLEAFVPGYTGLARVKAARGDWEGAFSALDELAALGEGNPAMVLPAVESVRALLWVAQGNVDAANQWTMNAGLDPEGEIDFHQLDELMVLSRVLIARCVFDEAVYLLTRMVDVAKIEGRLGKQIEIHILLALAHHRLGSYDESMIVLERALISAEPEGYVRIFVGEGDPMETLLLEAKTRGIAAEYVHKLLAAFEADNIQLETPSAHALIEPLSERELEVLRLLKTELSGPEIADELAIALSTIRTHTQNIYSKLGVRSRREAVRKAKELNFR